MKNKYIDIVNILRDLDQCENLDATNVIEKIKKCLEEKAENLYSSWKEENFDINHRFLLASWSGNAEKEFSFIDIALYNLYDQGDLLLMVRPSATPFYNIAKALIRAGAEIHNGLEYLLYYANYVNNTDAVEFLLKNILIKNPDESISDLLRHNNTVLEFLNKCLEEIKRMKEEKIDNGITLFDVLVGNNNQSASHIRRASAALNKDKYKKFLIYADEIENQYQKLKERLELIGEGYNNLCKVFPSGRTESDKELPKELSERVVELLSDIDIKNLNEAVRSTYSETTLVYSEELKGSFCQKLEQKRKLKFEPKVQVQLIGKKGQTELFKDKSKKQNNIYTKADTNSKKSELPGMAVSILAIVGVALGVVIAVYPEMLAVGIAVIACCLVAAAVICYCNKPLDSLENSSAETVANRVQEVDQ